VVNRRAPHGYLGAEGRITSGPAAEMVEAGYAVEIADAPLLHRGLGLADLAHLLALRKAGAVPPGAAGPLAAELLRILDTPVTDFPYDAVYGDAYNSRERELERRLGTGAGWLHTGRTRREAGRIAFRLALRDRLIALHEAVSAFGAALSHQALVHAATVWADNTYLQPAQPSTFGHYLGAFSEEAGRHLDRIEWAFRQADQSPAGVGGVGGPRVPLDRGYLADLLGFATVGAHTRDVMWSIDGTTDAVLAATQAATTVDRLAEDWEVFTSPGFGYLTLHPSLCRASVLMPQKRNPYALAVIRAGTNTLIGRATGLLATGRTPSARTDNWLHTYREVADALERSRRLVALATEAVRTVRIDKAALCRVAGEHFTGAADLAEELVLRCGLDYRSAYRVVGHAVAPALTANRTRLSAADLARSAEAILGSPIELDDEVVAAALDPVRIVTTRTVPGGSAPERVRDHARTVQKRLHTADCWRDERRDGIEDAERRLLAAARELAGFPG
jgi:argininosuccinate lyase